MFEWNVRTLSSPTKWHQTQNSWRWIGESLLSYPSRLLISYTKKIIWHMWTRALIYQQEFSGLIWWLLEIGKLDRREVCGEFSWCLLWFFSLASAVMGTRRDVGIFAFREYRYELMWGLGQVNQAILGVNVWVAATFAERNHGFAPCMIITHVVFEPFNMCFCMVPLHSAFKGLYLWIHLKF